jgi:hypothetical protein
VTFQPARAETSLAVALESDFISDNPFSGAGLRGFPARPAALWRLVSAVSEVSLLANGPGELTAALLTNDLLAA